MCNARCTLVGTGNGNRDQAVRRHVQVCSVKTYVVSKGRKDGGEFVEDNVC